MARKRGTPKKKQPAPKRKPAPKPKMVRKTLMLEQEKIDFIKQAFDLTTDAEALTFALDHLLSHFTHEHEEE